MAEKKKEDGFDLSAKLAGLPKMSKSDTQKGPLALAYADIDTIHPNPYNAKVYTLSELDGLMEAILLEGGLQQPLYVVQKDEEWEVTSGHRRHAALSALVKGSDKHPPHPELRLVPVVYRPGAVAEDQARVTDGELDDEKSSELSRLMAELRVIIGNMANRKQTATELSAAATELEEHYAALARLGVKFPGRLREQVAKALQTSESKLARLKVIRENLAVPKFVRLWEANQLTEQAAYALAQMPTILQEAISEVYTGEGVPVGWRLEDVKKQGMEFYLTPKTKCPGGDGCTNGKGFLAHEVDDKRFSGPGICKCCVTCSEVTHCKYACPAGKEEATKRRSEASARNANQRAAEKRRIKTLTGFNTEFIKRIASACDGDKGVYDAAINSIDPGSLLTCYAEMHHTIPSMAFEGNNGRASTLISLPVNMLATLCQRLNVSADYLLGLVDTPLGQLCAANTQAANDGKLAWQPADKPPEKSGVYYCKFDFSGTTRLLAMRWNAANSVWEWPDTSRPIAVACLGWYPVPDDEKTENETDVEE